MAALIHPSKGKKLNAHTSLKQPWSFVTAVAIAMMALSVITACSPTSSTEESAAQTKASIDRAVRDSEIEMAAEKDKQNAIENIQMQEKARQDAAVARAVENTKKEFTAKQEQRAKQRARVIAADTRDYSAKPAHENTSVCANCAVVLSVNEIDTEGKGSGLGVVAGGVLGGVLGHQVGDGSGRDLATIAGAIGGAFAGNKIEKVTKKSKSYNIAVKMDTGEERTFNQVAVPVVVSGDKVKIENDMVVKR